LLCVHRAVALDVIEQRGEQRRGPAHASRALRRDDDQRQLGARSQPLRQPLRGDKLEVIAALAGSVQDEQKRPAPPGPLL